MRTRTYTYTWCKVHVPTRVVIESTCKQCVDTHTYNVRTYRVYATLQVRTALHRRAGHTYARTRVRTCAHALCVRSADSGICTLHHVCVRTCAGVGQTSFSSPFFLGARVWRAPPAPPSEHATARLLKLATAIATCLSPRRCAA